MERDEKEFELSRNKKRKQKTGCNVFADCFHFACSFYAIERDLQRSGNRMNSVEAPRIFRPTHFPRPFHIQREMIYDVSSPQFRQFLRATAHRRENEAPRNRNAGSSKSRVSKPSGASSTGL